MRLCSTTWGSTWRCHRSVDGQAPRHHANRFAVTPSVALSILLVLLSALCIGIGSALIKLLLVDMSLFRLGFYRAFFALVLTIPAVLIAGEWQQLQITWRGAGLGLLNALIILGASLIYMNTVRSGSLSTVQPITQSYPLFAFALGSLILGEQVTLPLALGTLGVVGGLCGVILGSEEGIHLEPSFARSVMWALACSAVLGFQVVETKLALEWVPAMSLNLLSCLVALVAYRGILCAQGVKPWRGIGRRDVALAALSGLLTLGISGILFNVALRHIPAVVASPLLSTSLLFSVLCGVVMFGEHVSRIQVLSSLLVIAGVAGIAAGQG